MAVVKRALLIPLLTVGLLAAAACAGSGDDGTFGDGGTSEDRGDTADGDAAGDAGDTADGDDMSDSGEQMELGTGDGTFTVRTEEFVDDSRPTTPGIPQRRLVTDIYVPGGDGPFPLVMHAHGMDGTAAKFSQLLSRWAEAGYVVVAPNFPRTNGDAPAELRDLSDYLNQPDDVTHVLDQVLAMNEPDGELDGLVATEHIGVSGLSLGGATTYPLLFNSCCRDVRYSAAILMSALELPFGEDPYDYSRRIPVLAFAGTEDASIPFELQQDIITKIAGPKWNVTLPGGQHSQPFENNPSPQDDLVFATTVDFWDLTLRDDETAADRLVADATVDGLSFVDVTP